MKQNFLPIFFILTSGIILFGCTNENIGNTKEDEFIELEITLLKNEQQSLKSKTRTTENGQDLLNENLIKSLDIFFYEQGIDNCHRHEKITPTTPLSGTTHNKLILQSRKPHFTQGVNYQYYVIANLEDHLISTIPTNGWSQTELKNLITSINITPDQIQTSFLMDGVSNYHILNDGTVNRKEISIELNRAAAKIRVGLYYKNGISPATGQTPQKKIINYVGNSRIVSHNNELTSSILTNSEMTDITTIDTENGSLPGFILYSYENDWNENQDRETYIIANIPLEGKPENYYKIPVNFRMSEDIDKDNPSDDSDLKKIKRNYLYNVTAQIDKEGSESLEEPVEVEGESEIVPWEEINFPTMFPSHHWLYVKENSIRMINIEEYQLEYSADLPVDIINMKATYLAISVTGNESLEEYIKGVEPDYPNGFYPIVDIDPVNFKLTIKSLTPNNYVPLNIEFDVTNNDGLTEHVEVIQYPLQYITSEHSKGDVVPAWHEDPTQNNYNLFTITCLYSEKYIIGDPTLGNLETDSTAAVDNIISPRFVVASQHGIFTDGVTWERARQRCLEYGEDKYRSGWRMPTQAEIALVNSIQFDTNSAIKKLFFGPVYWYAKKNWGYKLSQYEISQVWYEQSPGPIYSETGAAFPAQADWRSSRGAIRCVHDDY